MFSRCGVFSVSGLNSEPHLSNALRVMLPTPVETLLLRGCLLPGKPGRDAWKAWYQRVPNPNKVFEENRTGLKGLLPLVRKGIEGTGFDGDKGLQTYARAAYLHEERRYKAYRDLCTQVLTALNAAQIPVIALKACVVAETAYQEPADRHCHALDLLVQENDVVRVGAVIEGADFAKSKIQLRPGPQHVSYQHKFGLPLELHTRLLALPHYNLPVNDIWSRSERRSIAGVSTRILSPADNLLHICGLAAGERARVNLRWACDSWQIITRHPGLDWNAFLDATRPGGLTLPLYVLLRYLTNELSAPVPDEVLQKLEADARRVQSKDREAALFGAITGLSLARRALFDGSASWQSRFEVAKYILAPSPTCLRWSFPGGHWLTLPLYYLYRPVRYVVSRVRGLVFPPDSED